MIGCGMAKSFFSKSISPVRFAFNAAKNIIRKSNETPATQRMPRMAFVDYLIGRGEYKLAAYQAVDLYAKCPPLFDGIDRICNAVSAIQPKVFSVSGDQRVPLDNHPLTLLLKNPYFGTTTQKFMQRVLGFLIITGDSFVVANAMSKTSAPKALFVIPPQSINSVIGDDGYVKTYQATLSSRIVTYERETTTNGNKYYAKLDKGIISELYHIKTFNPFSSDYEVKGLSPINSAYYDVEQYAASSVHNFSLLKRGTTMDGIFLIDKALTDEELMRLKAQIEEYHSGDFNAGKPFVMDNAAATRYEQKANKSKDMDFEKMKKDIRISIYSLLKIPLPKVNSETMTMANLDAAQESFYDDAVLPWAEMVHSELSMFLINRYTQDTNLILSYDPSKISALRTRSVENLLRLEKSNVLRINELRNIIGFDPIPGGNELFIPSNVVPISGDTSDSGENSSDGDDDADQDRSE